MPFLGCWEAVSWLTCTGTETHRIKKKKKKRDEKNRNRKSGGVLRRGIDASRCLVARSFGKDGGGCIWSKEREYGRLRQA